MRIIETVIDDMTLEETAPQVLPAFPYRTGVDDLLARPGHLCPWHWHGEVELFYMRSGSLEYHLPGRTQLFRTGDAGFVNAGVPHMTRAAGGPDCLMQEHIFLPALVAGAPGSGIERNYVAPLLRNSAAEMIVVPASRPESEALRVLMDDAFAAFQARDMGYEIVIRDLMSRAWLLLLRLAPDPGDGRRGADQARIKSMLRFIESNCGRPISLAEIARAANISCREANRCFRRQLGMTPFEYLLEYRLERARQLLANTDLPVTQVGLRCGFSSASYFGKLFRQKTGRAPSEYRERGD